MTTAVVLDVVAATLILGGSVLALTAAIGVVRFPDTLSRMHAATKPQVLGLLLVLALAVNVINLIPGSIVLEIDQTRRMIYVHVIDAGSERSVSRFYHQVAEVERLMIASFERPVDWQASQDKEDA